MVGSLATVDFFICILHDINIYKHVLKPTTMEFEPALISYAIAVASQIMLHNVNWSKSNRDDPTMFKFFMYFAVFLLTIGAYIVSNHFLKFDSNLVSYASVTAALSVLHFLFDEDILTRFEKTTNIGVMLFITTVAFFFWSVLQT